MSETILVCIINSIVTLIIGVVSASISIKISNNTTKKEIKHFKEEETYKVKKDAIYETLQFLDNYLSWLTIDGGKTKAVRNNVTTAELTLEARKCYNKLCTTCDNELLIEKFNKIVFRHDENIFCLLNEFRNIARKELGLDEICLSEEEIFINIVSTDELNKKERKQCRDTQKPTTKIQ